MWKSNERSHSLISNGRLFARPPFPIGDPATAVHRPYFKLPEPLSGARPDASPSCPLNCACISRGLSGRNPLFDSDVLPLPLPRALPSFRLICIRTSHTETSSASLEGRDITKNERKDGRTRKGERGRALCRLNPNSISAKMATAAREGDAFCRHKAISPRTISLSFLLHPSSPSALSLSCIDSDVSRDPRAP